MRSTAWLETAIAVLAACSLEAAWIMLLYITATALATHAPGPLSLFAFALAALGGLLLSRRIGVDRHRARTLLATVAIVVALGGWLVPLGLDATRVIDQPYALLELHPAGLLLGLAVLLGTVHRSELDDERIGAIALGPGIVFVAGIWGVLSLAGATSDPAILGDAYAATITFVTAALLSLGLARLTGLREARSGPGGGRVWIGLLLAVVVGLLLVALPLAVVIGAPLDAAVRGVLGPISAVLVPIVMILALPAALVGTALVALIEWLRGGSGGSDPGIDISVVLRPAIGGSSGPPGAQAVALGLVPIVLAIIVAFFVIRSLLHTTTSGPDDDDVREVREIERPGGGIRLHLPHRQLRVRPYVPETASEAYLATLELLTRTPDSARRGSETPREHADRVGRDRASFPLRRLAADYALAEFGGRALSSAEHRRAIDSWRRMDSVIREGWQPHDETLA